MTSRLLIRVAGLVLAVGVVWYITHLNAELARMRAATPGTPAAAPAAPAVPAEHSAPAAGAGSTAPRALTPEQRQAMIQRLSTTLEGAVSTGHPVWFATVPNNPEATAFQKTLQGVFEEAGWKVEGNEPIRFPMKAGIYVFAADEEPPAYLSQVNDAFEAAGLTITSGRGYRDFARQKKEENPSWVGLELGADHTYVIAVGRRPEPEPAS